MGWVERLSGAAAPGDGLRGGETTGPGLRRRRDRWMSGGAWQGGVIRREDSSVCRGPPCVQCSPGTPLLAPGPPAPPWPPAPAFPHTLPLASCPPGSEYQVLYIADDNEIRSLFPSHPHSAYEQAFQGDESVRIDAMDVHVKAGRVYWTNWHTGTISYRSLPPAAPPTTSNRHRREIDRGVTHLNVSARRGVGST